MDIPTPEAAPTGQLPPEAPGDMSQGYTIEISVLPDGTFSVSSEPLQAEATEETGEPGSETGQSAKSIGDALKIVLDIYKNSGTASNEQADFMSGFAPEGDKPQ